MVLEFPPKFIATILSGQQGFVLQNERKPEPKVGEVISMVTGEHTSIITTKHLFKGKDKVRLIINKKELSHKLLVMLNERPLSVSETMLFCFLAGYNSPENFCIFWLQGSKNTNLYKYMYRWIELPF